MIREPYVNLPTSEFHPLGTTTKLQFEEDVTKIISIIRLVEELNMKKALALAASKFTLPLAPMMEIKPNRPERQEVFYAL